MRIQNGNGNGASDSSTSSSTPPTPPTPPESSIPSESPPTSSMPRRTRSDREGIDAYRGSEDFQAEFGNRWSFDSEILLGSPASAHDKHGWYSAEVNSDGSAWITVRNPSRSMHNRAEGQLADTHDVRFFVRDIHGFVHMMDELAVVANKIILADRRAMDKAAAEKPRSITDVIEDEASLPSEREQKTVAMAKEYGLHELHLAELPDKLAEAVGIERNKNESDDDLTDRIFEHQSKLDRKRDKVEA